MLFLQFFQINDKERSAAGGGLIADGGDDIKLSVAFMGHRVVAGGRILGGSGLAVEKDLLTGEFFAPGLGEIDGQAGAVGAVNIGHQILSAVCKISSIHFGVDIGNIVAVGLAPAFAQILGKIEEGNLSPIVAVEHIQPISRLHYRDLGMAQLGAVGQVPVFSDLYQPPFSVDLSAVGDQYGRGIGEAVQFAHPARKHQLSVGKSHHIGVQLEGNGAGP